MSSNVYSSVRGSINVSASGFTYGTGTPNAVIKYKSLAIPPFDFKDKLSSVLETFPLREEPTISNKSETKELSGYLIFALPTNLFIYDLELFALLFGFENPSVNATPKFGG